jgi:calpain-7
LLVLIKHSDDAVFSMSAAQEANLDAWKRPAPLFKIDDSNDELQKLMDSTQGCDLVQDVTTDCSVVASLAAALKILTGKRLVSLALPSCLA